MKNRIRITSLHQLSPVDTHKLVDIMTEVSDKYLTTFVIVEDRYLEQCKSKGVAPSMFKNKIIVLVENKRDAPKVYRAQAVLQEATAKKPVLYLLELKLPKILVRIEYGSDGSICKLESSYTILSRYIQSVKKISPASKKEKSNATTNDK